jgi:thymidylate synthase (FAD)
MSKDKEFYEGQETSYAQAREDVYEDNKEQGIPRPEITEDEQFEATENVEAQIAEREVDRIESIEDYDPKLPVLDKGYVRLVDSMGSDLSVVNAARVSYDKESLRFNEKDDRLIHFLVRENHTAPFRHAIVSFEVYAPLFVARQWWKHVVGGQHNDKQMDPFLAWNESSRRYVTENEEFYTPTEWRGKPENGKQGSAGTVERGEYFTRLLETQQEMGLELYREAMEAGVAPEQARLFLPANGLYVRWRWTTSLQGAMHFIALREDSHAQWEIQQYAKAVKDLAWTVFPVSIGSLDA